MQESEAARQEAAADLQRCYKEAAGLQAQLSSLAASCRDGADRRVQQLTAQLQTFKNGLRQILACAEDAAMEDRDDRSDDGSTIEELPEPESQPRPSTVRDNVQIWVRPEAEEETPGGGDGMMRAIATVAALAESAKRAKRRGLEDRARAQAAGREAAAAQAALQQQRRAVQEARAHVAALEIRSAELQRGFADRAAAAEARFEELLRQACPSQSFLRLQTSSHAASYGGAALSTYAHLSTSLMRQFIGLSCCRGMRHCF